VINGAISDQIATKEEKRKQRKERLFASTHDRQADIKHAAFPPPKQKCSSILVDPALGVADQAFDA
jgi:hypothetical protein